GWRAPGSRRRPGPPAARPATVPPQKAGAPPAPRSPTPYARNRAGGSWSSSHLSPPFERLAERGGIRVLDAGAHRRPRRDARHLPAQRFDEAGQIERRGLAFDRRVGRQHDLPHAAVLQAPQQLADAQVFGADAVERREAAVQDVIAAAKLAGALEGDEIGG